MTACNPAWCAVVASLLMAGCLGFGSCTETEAFAFNAMRQYDDAKLVPEPHPSGACGASLVTGDDPDAVMEHYRSELEGVGFVVSPVASAPIVDENGTVVGRTLGLQATIETANASINAEVLDGQDTTFTILMDESTGWRLATDADVDVHSEQREQEEPHDDRHDEQEDSCNAAICR